MSRKTSDKNIEVVAVGGDLDVGGVIKNVKKDDVLPQRYVKALKRARTKKDGPTWYETLIKSGAIKEREAKDAPVTADQN